MTNKANLKSSTLQHPLPGTWSPLNITFIVWGLSPSPWNVTSNVPFPTASSCVGIFSPPASTVTSVLPSPASSPSTVE